jgi:hypothetical protein
MKKGAMTKKGKKETPAQSLVRELLTTTGSSPKGMFKVRLLLLLMSQRPPLRFRPQKRGSSFSEVARNLR